MSQIFLISTILSLLDTGDKVLDRAAGGVMPAENWDVTIIPLRFRSDCFVNVLLVVLQTLYDQLVVEGSQSLADALRVGAAIEEIDILDLEERIAGTGKADIQLVYQNLMKGSRNHLRAFTSTLERQTGETYLPQFLEPAAYKAIVTTPTERGNKGQGQRSGGQGQGRGSN